MLSQATDRAIGFDFVPVIGRSSVIGFF